MHLFVDDNLIVIDRESLLAAQRADPEFDALVLLRDLGKVTDAEVFEAYKRASELRHR